MKLILAFGAAIAAFGYATADSGSGYYGGGGRGGYSGGQYSQTQARSYVNHNGGGHRGGHGGGYGGGYGGGNRGYGGGYGGGNGVATGGYAVKRNYGGYGKGGYQRGGSLSYAKSFVCKAQGYGGYNSQLWCGQGYSGFACSLSGGNRGGYGGHRGGHHGGHRGHHGHGSRGGYGGGYGNVGYGGNGGYGGGRGSFSQRSYGGYTRSYNNNNGGGYGNRRYKRSSGYGGYGAQQSYGAPSYGGPTTCWRQDGKKLSCQSIYGGNYKCTASGSKHYGQFSYQTQGGHGGSRGGYGGPQGGYGGRQGGYGGHAAGRHGSHHGRGGHRGHGSPHGGGIGYHNLQYGGKNYHQGIPFGLHDVEKEAGETDKNANKCKKECWLNAQGKRNCKVKCCNWQCPQVCVDNIKRNKFTGVVVEPGDQDYDDGQTCCQMRNPVPPIDDNDESVKANEAAKQARQECVANVGVNSMSCRMSCYVKMENLDHKQGKYHVSETFGRYQNAGMEAVKGAFNAYSEFYKDPNDANHLRTSSVLTADQIDGLDGDEEVYDWEEKRK